MVFYHSAVYLIKVNYTIAPLYQSFFIGEALATACTWKKLAQAKSEINMTA